MKLYISILSIILLYLFISCKSNNIILEYQNDKLLNNLGIGLVQQINTEKQIELYKDDELLTKLSYDTVNTVPIFYKPDYGILYFVCLENKNNYYKILLNNSNTAFIKKTPEYSFSNWNDFIKKSTRIESKNPKKYPIRDNINGKEINFKNLNDDSDIEVVEVVGDWVKIKNITKNVVYWLQWRDRNKLLVDINLLM